MGWEWAKERFLVAIAPQVNRFLTQPVTLANNTTYARRLRY